MIFRSHIEAVSLILAKPLKMKLMNIMYLINRRFREKKKGKSEMRTEEKEKALAYLEKTKVDAMMFYTEACEDVERWEEVINDCEDEALEIRRSGNAAVEVLVVKVALAIVTVLVLLSIVLTSGCQTVKEGLYGTGRLAGAAGQDAKWIAEKLADNIQVQEK